MRESESKNGGAEDYGGLKFPEISMVYPIPGKFKTFRGHDPIVDLTNFFPCRCFFKGVMAPSHSDVPKNR
jgi:hypothetical protein